MKCLTVPYALSELHICRGTGTRYQARVCRRGCRKFVLVGHPRKREEAAARDLLCAFLTGGSIKRGDVIMWADYYDPTVVLEIVRP